MQPKSPTTSAPLELELNGEAIETRARTLAGLIAERELGGVRVATAVNGLFVPEKAREMLALNAGDKVEIVSARQGG